MGLWARLTGQEGDDTTVTDVLNRVNVTPATPVAPAADQPRSTGAASNSFRMTIEDVFTITGRGTVAIGTVGSGTIAVGDSVQVSGPPLEAPITRTVVGLEAFRKQLTRAEAGTVIGVLLSNVTAEQLASGTVLSGS